MILVGMHAAITHQAQEVQAFAFGLGKGIHQDGLPGEFAFTNALVDAGQVLIDDAAGPKVEVAHFAVAHLAIGEAHVLTTAAHGAPGVLGIELVVKGRVSQQRGVAVFDRRSFAAGIDPPAVANDEYNRFSGHGDKLGAASMPAKGPGIKQRKWSPGRAQSAPSSLTTAAANLRRFSWGQ